MVVSGTSRQALEHVLWIGGAPDAGKTSVADVLAWRYGFEVYHFDRYEMAHFAQAEPVRHPALWAAHPDRMTTEQRWLGSPPEAMASATIASWSERCGIAFEEIAALAVAGPVIAEGPGFFPDAIAPVLTDPQKAIWLVPSEDFKRRSAAERDKPGNKHETSNPELATANLIARDLLMGQHIQARCTALGLACLVVTGNEGLDDVVARVEEQFRPWLDDTSRPCQA